MNLTMIAAIARNYGIGKNGKLLWHLPADMAFFRKMTLGKTVLMGRKTYESIGRPLINRKNIVLTHQDISIEGVSIIHHLKDIENTSEDIMVIGGEKIYELCMPLAKKLIITEVDAELEADTFFPKINLNQFKCISAEKYSSDERNLFSMVFKEYRRI